MTNDGTQRRLFNKTFASHLAVTVAVIGSIVGIYADAKGDIRSNTEAVEALEASTTKAVAALETSTTKAVEALEKTLSDPAIGIQVKLARVERIVVRLADRAGIQSD